MEDVERFRFYMSKYNLDESKIAKITGYSEDHVLSMLKPGHELPRWLKLVLHVWEKTEKSKS